MLSAQQISENYKKTMPRVKEKSRLRIKRIRYEILEEFGSKCVCCGISDPDILQFDHIHNDGYKESQHRNPLVEMHRVGILPHKYQLLCANCNMKKRFYFSEFKRLSCLSTPPF